MKEIWEGLKTGGEKFAAAIYELFYEFREEYKKEEWPRLDGCERMYQGDHWHDIDVKPNEPKPTTPIIFSTIENIRADLTDEFPEAIIKPETSADEIVAKILTEVVKQTVEASDYDKEYDSLTHDLCVGGWTVQEAGWDASLNQGRGGGFLRHVSNKNFLADPYAVDVQDGRAVFKFDRLPAAWFEQHYPEQYPKFKGDEETIPKDHVDFDSTTKPTKTDYYILIEAWIKMFDYELQKHTVHMVKLAGQCVLENSYQIKPEGYFAHGMYPFIITPLFEQKGTSIGLGIVDMFKSAQQYSDKIDQIVLKNALTAGHNRFLVMEDSVDIEDLKDYSKEVITTTAPPNSVMQWVQDRPLPSHILVYTQQMRDSIKEESGSNDFSRGNVSAGVTAASAITALQEMSSKRSRMEARRIHYGFKQAVRMLIDVIREFEVYPRQVVITMNGEPVPVILTGETYKTLGGQDGTLTPIEYSVSIKTARETKYTKLANNQLMLEFMAMFQGQVDPLIMLEAMDMPSLEPTLEKMRAAQSQGMTALQNQLQEAMMALEQLTGENQGLKNALVSAQAPGEIPGSLAIDTPQPGGTGLI